MNASIRLACAGSALLASTLHASDSTSEYEDFNICSADGNPVHTFSGEWWAMNGSSGDYRLTMTANYEFPWFWFGTDINRSQLGGTDFEIHEGFPWSESTVSFAYNVDLPYTVDTAETSSWEVMGFHYSHLESNPNAPYSGWMRFGASGPQLPFSGKIGYMGITCIYY